MLPPGPRSPALWQTYRFITKPLEYSRAVVARYGDATRMNVLNARGVAVASAELARQVFAADPDTFEAAPTLGDLFGGHSLLATSGPTHRRPRKLLNPRFHGAHVKAFLATMQRVTHEHFAVFAGALARNEEVVMSDLAQALTLDLILDTVFGESPQLDRPRSRSILLALIGGLSPAIVAGPFFRRPFFPPWRRFVRARAQFDAWVDSLIAERRGAAALGNDILGVLLEARYDDGSAMPDAEIRDQLMTLLLAGHETTAVAVSWGVYWLLREPSVLERLRIELDALGSDAAPETIVRLPYLQAVCSESLRIEPVVTDVGRVCKKPLVLGAWTVPAGETVVVNLTVILRDPRVFPEPHRFRPERFLERSHGAGEFLPFGGGQRRCLGAAFAEAELAIVLATVARDWDLELVSHDAEIAVRRNITMGPKSGVRVRVLGRRQART
jgi:cytochrome P450 family 110